MKMDCGLCTNAKEFARLGATKRANVLPEWGVETLHHAPAISFDWDGSRAQCAGVADKMNDKIRVVVIDDHPLMRQGIVGVLEKDDGIEVVRQGSCGYDILHMLASHEPDVLITDLQMPWRSEDPRGERLEPISTIKRAIGLHTGLKVCVITQESTVQVLQSLVEIGVVGLIMKSDSFAATLTHAIRLLQVGGTYFSPDAIETIESAPSLMPIHKLSEKQKHVLRVLINDGLNLSHSEQAALLGIAPSTLYKHQTGIVEAMGLSSIQACMVTAIRQKLLERSAAVQTG